MEYPTVPLADIPINRLKTVKRTVKWFGDQDHCRWVLTQPGTADVFYKIWNPTYIRRDNILPAIVSRFYDEQTTPALAAIIKHNGICRGYVMKRCRPNRKLNVEFYELIKKKTLETGFFQVQFSPYHTMKYGTGFSLTDLEAVYPISRFTEVSEQFSKFDYPDYERFVARLHSGKPVEDQPAPPVYRSSNAVSRAAFFAYRKSRGAWKRLKRETTIKWECLNSQTHLIQI